ncbi:MAG: universal stress protein [Rhodothermaceae bacterium]|nr:universal stress protein [Rhodothermaceae bacterium]
MFAPERLLIPVDFSGASTAALRRGLDIAERTGAEVHVLHIVPGFAPVLGADLDALPEEDQAFFQRVWDRADGELTALLHREQATRVRRVLSFGLPSTVLLDYAQAQDVDLIVMGTHGRRGVRHALLGSVAEEVLRRAEVSVLVVPEAAAGRAPFFHVLVPTDFSLASRMALPIAAEVADLYGAKLTLLHTLEPIPYLSMLTGVTAGTDVSRLLREKAEVQLHQLVANTNGALARAETALVEGRAAEAVVAYADEHGVDAIVMAKHGLHGMARFLVGSVTERICRTAPCAVLVVPVDDDTA